MSLSLNINNKPYDLWETASLRRSIDENCGSYSFTSSSGVPKTSFPVEPGDFAEVFVNGIRKAVGFIDTIRVQETAGRHTIACDGRDATQDLIDSSVPDDAKTKEGPVTMKQLCEKVINDLGLYDSIKVLDWVSDPENPEILEPFATDELSNSESADTCMSYLVSFARKRQVYLVSMVGKKFQYLVIYRPFAGDTASSPIVHRINDPNNNVISYMLKVSHADRFHTYLCRTQSSYLFPPIDGSAPPEDVTNEITDKSIKNGEWVIRESRYLEIQGEQSMDTNECLTRAIEESNLRRVNGQLYTCTVAGHTQSNGTPWDYGQMVTIEDDFAGVHGIHLIKEVELITDIARGERTKIVCVPPDGYTTIPFETTLLQKLTITGKLNQILPYPSTLSPVGVSPSDTVTTFRPKPSWVYTDKVKRELL